MEVRLCALQWLLLVDVVVVVVGSGDGSLVAAAKQAGGIKKVNQASGSRPFQLAS